MACSGTYCVNCSTNACEGKYRAARTGNPYSFPDIGTVPTASFTNHLKTALNTEISARNSQRSYGLTTVGFTDVVAGTNLIAKSSTTEVLDELKTRLNAIINNSMYSTAISKATSQTTAGSYPSTGGDGLSSTSVLSDVYTAGDKFTAAHWTNIRDKILSLMRECLCNGDCGSNYWCGCHNDCGCNYSDINLKENVSDDEISLEKFNEVKSKSWNYTFDKEHKFFGPIAQDVEKVFPEAIREDGQGYKMLNQISMMGILWGALNKSIDKINELETRLEELEKK